MRPEEVKLGSAYVNIKHNVREYVTALCKLRKDDGSWVDGVVYKGNDRHTGEPMHFACTLESFCERFEKGE